MKTLVLYKDGSTAHPEFPFGPVFQGLLVSDQTHSVEFTRLNRLMERMLTYLYP